MADTGVPGGTLRAHHGFLVTWGAAEEIGRRIAEVRATLGWWASRQGDAGGDEVGAGLGAALAALSELHDSAKAVEAALDAGGYEFDRHLRIIRGKRRPDRGDGSPVDRDDRLLEETIGEFYGELREDGQASGNTPGLRIQIRGRLARSLHPDLLSDAVIRSAVDRVLGREAPVRE